MPFSFNPLPHKEAVARIADLPLVTREVMDGLLPELKAYAFTVTGLDAFDQLAKVRDAIGAVPAGEKTWDKAKAEIAADLDEAIGGKEAGRRAELLLRTHTFRGYAATRYRTLMQQRDVFPYWQYKTHGDGNVRPAHAALNGKIFPAGHPIWQRIFPPWDWGCRCLIVPLMASQVAKFKAADKGKAPEAMTVYEGDLADAILKAEKLPNGIALARQPTWAGSPWSEPGTVRHDWPLIRERYADQPEVLKAFEKWARKTKLGESKTTVWTWIGGEAKPRKAKSVTKTAAAPAEPLKLQFPDDVKGLKTVKKLGGSTGAVLVEDANGVRFVMKRGASADHLREEVLADGIYSKMGAHVPEAKLYETAEGPVKLAKFIEGQTLGEYLAKATPAQRAEISRRIGEHFHADVLMGNWDVIGMGKDNILVDKDGMPWRIDNGGSLRFRAMGSLKNDAWNAYPDELWTLRDAAKNPQTAEMFKDLRLVDVAHKMQTFDIDALEAPEEVKAVLRERWKNLKDVTTKALDMEHDGWRDSYTDNLCRHMMGLRKAGITADLPKEMKQAVGDVYAVDENGKAWDDLRASKGKTAASAPTLLPGDKYWPSILDAGKSLNHHAVNGDFNYNAGKVNAALAHKADLTALAKKKGDEGAMAKSYLKYLEQIENAKKLQDQKTKSMVPNLTPFTPKGAKKAAPAKTQSLIERLAEYVKANGGDYRAVTRWKQSQGGDSWNADAQAKKAWVARHLNIPAHDVWWKNGASQAAQGLQALEKSLGVDEVDAAFTIHHAFVQEFLAATEFRHNDRTLRALRLVRTEKSAVLNAYGVKQGKDVNVPRGLCESSSPFRVTSVYGSEATLQAVPHSKVLGSYFMEKTPGAGDCGFLGDGENEFTFVAAKTPFRYTGSATKQQADMDAGNDAAAWGLPIDHLRK
jgi:SPP1 gp7 family putative phage head morphogenesis protein